jgi:polar amino acid transport system substrate-binding protein
MLAKILTKRNIALILLIIVLLAWGLMRSCTQEEAPNKQFYTIGRDNTWYPFHLRGKEWNLIAFTNDLMAAIAKETKLNWKWVETSPTTLLEGLDDQQYDAIISSMQPNFINRKQYLFSELIFKLGLVLVVQKNSSVTSLKDLQGKTLGISNSSYPIFQDIREGGPHTYDIRLKTYDNINQALDSLENGQLDGIITHTIQAYAITTGFNKNIFKVVTAPITDEGLRLITLKNKDSEALIKNFDQALNKLKENGVYAQLIDKWDLIDPSTEYLKKINTKTIE